MTSNPNSPTPHPKKSSKSDKSAKSTATTLPATLSSSQQNKPRSYKLIFSIVFLIAALGSTAVYAYITNSSKASKGKISIDTNSFQSDESQKRKDVLKLKEYDISSGKTDAKVKIIVYGSFSCSHCAKFYTDVFPTIKKLFVKTGKAIVIHRDFPLDKVAMLATQVVDCYQKNYINLGEKAPNDKVFNLVLSMYYSQKDWISNNRYKDKLTNIATQAQGNEKGIKACVKNEHETDYIIERAFSEGKILNIKGTPVIFINGTRVVGGKNNINGILSTIREEYAKEEASSTPEWARPLMSLPIHEGHSHSHEEGHSH